MGIFDKHLEHDIKVSKDAAKKVGRPKKDKTVTRHSISLSELDAYRLDEICEYYETSKSNTIRTLVNMEYRRLCSSGAIVRDRTQEAMYE